MSVIDRLSSSLGRRDQGPNQELAAELCETRSRADIEEVVANLSNEDRRIQSDCIGVLYEIGYIDPDLIAPYAGDFLALLRSRNNRLVWGAMAALSSIAGRQADQIYEQLDLVLEAIDKGSVITVDGGISVLAGVATANEDYESRIVPYLLEHLRTCRPKEVAQHAERAAVAVNTRNRDEFIQVLEGRLEDLSETQQTRLRRLMRKLMIE